MLWGGGEREAKGRALWHASGIRDDDTHAEDHARNTFLRGFTVRFGLRREPVRIASHTCIMGGGGDEKKEPICYSKARSLAPQYII